MGMNIDPAFDRDLGDGQCGHAARAAKVDNG